MTKNEALRHECINSTVSRFLNPADDYNLRATATQANIVATIQELDELGRSPRWKDAIRSWASAVATADTRDTVRHWLLQGSVWATTNA